MIPVLETERLYLRNLQEADVETIYEYRNAEECYKYQRWDDCSVEAMKAYVQKFAEDVFLSEKEEQHYGICEKAGDSFVGELAYFYTEEDRCITLGITISHHYHKRGFAFEILSAVIQKIRATYPQLDIVGLIEKENVKSRNLFEKLGFVQECYAESIASYVYVIYGMK